MLSEPLSAMLLPMVMLSSAPELALSVGVASVLMIVPFASVP